MSKTLQILLSFFSLWLHSISGTIVQYNLVFSRAIQNVDKFNKSIILVNGQFPGPSLRVKVGDTITVVVSNFLMEMEALSVHWHGIDQLGTPW